MITEQILSALAGILLALVIFFLARGYIPMSQNTMFLTCTRCGVRTPTNSATYDGRGNPYCSWICRVGPNYDYSPGIEDIEEK